VSSIFLPTLFKEAYNTALNWRDTIPGVPKISKAADRKTSKAVAYLPGGVQLGNQAGFKAMQIDISTGSTFHGSLNLGRGGVEWRAQRKRSGKRMSWLRFVNMLEKELNS